MVKEAQGEKYEKLHAVNMKKYERAVAAIFDKMCEEAAALGISTGWENGTPGDFKFENFPKARKKFTDLMWRVRKELRESLENGMAAEWDLSDMKNEELTKYLLEHANKEISEDVIKKMHERRRQGLAAFQERKVRGLGLSERVWNTAALASGQIELAIEQNLSQGISAQKLSQDVRQCLKEPDMMYRRYHKKITLADGSKKDIRVWYRKRVGTDGKVHFVEEPLERVGTGVYRSSYKNAMRMARTETNMAYRKADSNYYIQSSFVIGVRVILSNNHTTKYGEGEKTKPLKDICDELAGDYPKEFDFTGWHPQCRCTAVPITPSMAEMKEYLKRKAAGEDMSGWKWSGEVTKLPHQFTQWISNNQDRLMRMQKKGTLPYFVRENMAPNFRIGYGVDFEDGVKWGKYDWEYFPEQDMLRSSEKGAARLRGEAKKVVEEEKIDEKTLAEQALERDAVMYTDAQRANFAEIELAINQRRGLSMSYEDANTSKENPHYHDKVQMYEKTPKGDFVWVKKGRGYTPKKTREYELHEGYTVNCQTCTVVHELRRRGFNVEAISNYRGKVWNIYKKNGVGSNREGYRIGKWLNNDGTPVKPYYAEKWMIGKGYHTMTKGRIDEFMSEMMRNDGRFEIYVDWKGGSAHVFCAEKKDGVVTFFDPQSGKTNVWDDGKGHGYKYQCKPGMIGVVRVDNKLINPKLAESWIGLGELPIEFNTVSRKDVIFANAKKRHESRTKERELEIRDFWNKKKEEGDKRRHREEILRRAEERHAARTPEQSQRIIDKRNAELKQYADWEKNIRDAEARAKSNDWLTDEEKALWVDGSKGTRYHLDKYNVIAERLKQRMDVIDALRPDWNLSALHSSVFGVYKDKLDEARRMITGGFEVKAKDALSFLKKVAVIEPSYLDMRTYQKAHPGKGGKKSKIEIALDEAEEMIKNGDFAGAVAKIKEAEKIKQINEASKAAKAEAARKKKEEEARKKAEEEAKKNSSSFTMEDATSLDDVKLIYGKDLPKTVEEIDIAVSKFTNVSSELKANRDFVEKGIKQLFDDCDFGMAIEHSLLGSVFDKGFLNTFEVGASKGYCGSSKTTGKIEESHGRLVASHKMFNPSQSSSISYRSFKGVQFKRSEYEKYGHVLSKDKTKAMKEQRVWYGDVQVRFKKKDVCTTWTYNDSLGEVYQPSLCVDPKIESLDSVINKRNMFDANDFKDIVKFRDKASSRYVELQYHGRLTVDCVDSLTFPKKPDLMISKELIKKYVDKGIDIFYLDSNTGKVVLFQKGKPQITHAEAKVKLDGMKSELDNMFKNETALSNKDVSVKSIKDKMKNSDYIGALEEMERYKEIEERRKKLVDLIPDAEKWHKQFTIEELENAHKAITAKIDYMDNTYKARNTPDDVLKKWKEEIDKAEHPDKYKAGAKRFPTWEVAKKAYERKRNELVYEYHKTKIDDDLRVLRAFKTKDKDFILKMEDLEKRVNLGEWADVETMILEANDIMRDMGVTVLRVGESRAVKFEIDEFTQAKRDAAKWFKDPDVQKAYKEADDYMTKYAQDMWKNLSEEEKHVLWLYTDGSRYINEEMLGSYVYRCVSPIDGTVRNGLEDANTLTSIIDKSPALKDAMWMQSGKSADAFRAMFGVDIRTVTDLNALVGKEGFNSIFSSCHASSDGYFTKGGNTGATNQVVMSIYMPKGTKGVYLEPISSYGDNLRWKKGFDWKGTKRREAPSDQVEFLLQRGAKFKITKAYYKNGKWYVDVDLIEQTAVDALDTSIPMLNYRSERISRKPTLR